MKITKRKGDASSIRKVTDNGTLVGVFGIVADLVVAGILDSAEGVVDGTGAVVNDGTLWVWAPASMFQSPEITAHTILAFDTYKTRDGLLKGIGYTPDEVEG